MTNGSTFFPSSAMGKSRSATMILAYLLWHSRRRALSTPPPNPDSDTAPIPPKALDVPTALALLRQSRPIAEPNDGFMEQLNLYYAMGCPEEVEAQPKYHRWLYQRTVQQSLSVNRAPEVSDVRFEDEHLVDGEGDLQTTNLRDGTEKDRDLELKCRKCRRLLARGNFTAKHEPPAGKNKKDCAHLFLHPLSWMKDVLSAGQLDGRLSCPNPKCNANIGKFAWQGMRCSCNGWVTPAFGLIRAKIDETMVVTRKDASMAAAESAAPQGGGAVRMPPGMRRVEGGNL